MKLEESRTTCCDSVSTTLRATSSDLTLSNLLTSKRIIEVSGVSRLRFSIGEVGSRVVNLCNKKSLYFQVWSHQTLVVLFSLWFGL
uniref:Uncharacterized protein n=1 Tax=Gossypium raimondii TaxID=29730 RepID=A0A0D2NYK2_GOSRA|nr:hypothetical protein B456_003G090300 [Gossypium raimondii]